jgi:hypothetical protein
MPLPKGQSVKKSMHELKATRGSTKNPSRLSAKKHGTSHEQEIAIALQTEREGKHKGKSVPPKPKKGKTGGKK